MIDPDVRGEGSDCGPMSTSIRLMQDQSSWFWHSGESVCQMDRLVIEVVPVSLVLCVSSIPKGALKIMSPTHGSNWDARTKRPTHKFTPIMVQITTVALGTTMIPIA